MPKTLSDDQFDTHLADFARSILSLHEESVYHIWEKILEAREHLFVIQDEYVSLRGMVSMEDMQVLVRERKG